MTTQQSENPLHYRYQIDDRRPVAVTKTTFHYGTPRKANYSDVTVGTVHGSHWVEPRRREVDDGISAWRNRNSSNRQSQQQQQHHKQRHPETVFQNTPRSAMNRGSNSVGIGVSRDNVDPAPCVKFRHVHYADTDQDIGSGSHKESGYHSGESNDGGFLNRTTTKHTVTRDTSNYNVTHNTQGGYSTSMSATTGTQGSASGSLLMQAESEMDKYFVEERRGNMHEALMHINKAIYLYHQVLAVDKHASTGVVQQDQVRLRIIYNGAMLKLRRLVQQMTTSSPLGATPGSAHSNKQPAYHQPDVVSRFVDATTTSSPRKSSRSTNSWIDDNAFGATADGGGVTMESVVNGNDEYRSVQTYATLPKKSNVTRRTRDVLPQISHVDRRRDVSADRLVGRWTTDPVMSHRSPSANYRQFNSLPRPSADRQTLNSVRSRPVV